MNLEEGTLVYVSWGHTYWEGVGVVEGPSPNSFSDYNVHVNGHTGGFPEKNLRVLSDAEQMEYRLRGAV